MHTLFKNVSYDTIVYRAMIINHTYTSINSLAQLFGIHIRQQSLQQ